MKCEICGIREAVIHIEQIIGYEKVELHICEECARERGITTSGDKIEFSISNLIMGLVDVKDVHPRKSTRKVCPNCGTSFENFKKTGKLGCTECYVTFEREIRSILRKMYGKTQHVGKFPKQLKRYKTFLIDLEKLKEDLKKAIKSENYEKAAILRDRIAEIQKSTGHVDE